jgi:predicted aspartyl protease
MRSPLHESGAARLDVQIDAGNGRTKTISALLDTGASLCFIPHALASELSLVQRTWSNVGSLQRPSKEPGYYVRLTIPGLFDATVVMVEMKGDGDFVVVGRSVLKALRFAYDGAKGEFELSGA